MESNPDTASFYDRLKSFTDFRDITTDRHFERVPDDWSIIITDVKGSTRAIEAGRYKDVNTVGAASISVVQEALGREFPYVFGGDGATLLLPPRDSDAAVAALFRLQRLSREQFEMDLRVGRIVVDDLHDSACTVLVAKHELAGGKCVAVFRGGGLTEAERRIKADEESYCPEPPAQDLELHGLSCRWNPIPSQRGQILSLLVLARVEPPAKVYEGFLAELDGIFDGRLQDSNPVNLDGMSYKSVGDCVTEERRYHSSRATVGYLLRLLQILVAVLIFKFKVPALSFKSRRYAKSMRVHADYRKFDDMLRMVIDCSEGQADAILQYLALAHARGEVFFGVHRSDSALMTCYVQNVKDGGHIHFIDGGNGGYAMAAKQLKAQMKTE